MEVREPPPLGYYTEQGRQQLNQLPPQGAGQGGLASLGARFGNTALVSLEPLGLVRLWHSTALAGTIRHPDVKLWPPAGAQEAFSDAAGRSLLNVRAGIGILMPGGG